MNRTSRLAIFLAACGLLAGCTPHAAASTKVPAARYVVCTTLAAICTSTNLTRKPAEMYLSGDGSLFIKNIRWSGWGTATATGHGTAMADNCQPNCAAGTFSHHPATITATRPASWHGKMAYSRVATSIPGLSLEDHVYSTGLLPSATPPPTPPAASAPPAPGPVSTQAAVTGSCVIGYELPYDNDGSAVWGTFTAGSPSAGYTVDGSAPAVAYQVTLTNGGSSTAEVNGFVVAFYDTNGNELGSDEPIVQDEFLTAGQGLTWTEVSGTDTAGGGVSVTNGSQDNNIPSGGSAATCTMIEWTHP